MKENSQRYAQPKTPLGSFFSVETPMALGKDVLQERNASFRDRGDCKEHPVHSLAQNSRYRKVEGLCTRSALTICKSHEKNVTFASLSHARVRPVLLVAHPFRCLSSPTLVVGFSSLCFSTVLLNGLLYVLGSLCVMFCLVSTPLPMSPHYYSTSALLVVLLPYGFGHQLRVRERRRS